MCGRYKRGNAGLLSGVTQRRSAELPFYFGQIETLADLSRRSTVSAISFGRVASHTID